MLLWLYIHFSDNKLCCFAVWFLLYFDLVLLACFCSVEICYVGTCSLSCFLSFGFAIESALYPDNELLKKKESLECY